MPSSFIKKLNWHQNLVILFFNWENIREKRKIRRIPNFSWFSGFSFPDKTPSPFFRTLAIREKRKKYGKTFYFQNFLSFSKMTFLEKSSGKTKFCIFCESCLSQPEKNKIEESQHFKQSSEFWSMPKKIRTNSTNIFQK